MQRRPSRSRLWSAATCVVLLAAPACADRRSPAGSATRASGWRGSAPTPRSSPSLAAAALWSPRPGSGSGWLRRGAARRARARSGAGGRVCAALLPRVVLRLVAGSAGLGVLLAPLPAGAHAAATGPPRPRRPRARRRPGAGARLAEPDAGRPAHASPARPADGAALAVGAPTPAGTRRGVVAADPVTVRVQPGDSPVAARRPPARPARRATPPIAAAVAALVRGQPAAYRRRTPT